MVPCANLLLYRLAGPVEMIGGAPHGGVRKRLALGINQLARCQYLNLVVGPNMNIHEDQHRHR